MKKSTKKVIIWITVIAAVAVAAVFLLRRPGGKPQFTFETATVSRADISTFVTATGTIEPVTEVNVGTQVSGIIAKLFVDYNSVVKEGQIIAEMDKVTLESELASARAAYDGNKAEYRYQERNYERSKGLYEKKLISDADFEQAEYNYEMAKSAFHSSEAALAKAIDEGWIAGAGVDVFSTEPLPADNPLLNVRSRDKLILTPHIGWASIEARERLVAMIAENIEAGF